MQNVIHLLALLRFEAPPGAPHRVRQAVDSYAAWTAANGGYAIGAEPPQVLVCIPDAEQALESLHALMHEGERYGFTVSGGLVQAIRASERVPASTSDFTERTLATAIELAGAAGPQEIGVSTKLSSLLQLAVPDYANWFEDSADSGPREVSRVRKLLVLRSHRLPRYDGPMRIYVPG